MWTKILLSSFIVSILPLTILQLITSNRHKLKIQIYQPVEIFFLKTMFIFTIALFSVVLSLSMETECFVQPTNKPSHFLDPHSQIPFASSRSSWTQLAFFSNWNSLSIEKTNTTDATANVKDVDQSSFDNYIKLGFSPKITDVHDFNDFLSTIKDDERLCVVK